MKLKWEYNKLRKEWWNNKYIIYRYNRKFYLETKHVVVGLFEKLESAKLVADLLTFG